MVFVNFSEWGPRAKSAERPARVVLHPFFKSTQRTARSSIQEVL